MKIITPLLIAMVAHEVNRAYCQSLGDNSQVAWDEAPDWQRKSALMGVDMHTANPQATPAESHASWMAEKVANGWVYGETKDEKAKQHPCMLPYDELSPEQRAKDYVFRGVVHVMNRIASETQQVGVSGGVEPAKAFKGETAVTYIGRRPDYQDRVYGTDLTFARGQTRILPSVIAAKFLRHPDVFSAGSVTEAAVVEDAQQDAQQGDDTVEQIERITLEQAEQHKQINDVQDLHDSVQQMTKAGLEDFARTHYRQELDKRKSVAELRAEVIGFIDRFGAV